MRDCLMMPECAHSLLPVPLVCEERSWGYQIDQGNTGSRFTAEGETVVQLESQGGMAVLPEGVVGPEPGQGLAQTTQRVQQSEVAGGAAIRGSWEHMWCWPEVEVAPCNSFDSNTRNSCNSFDSNNRNSCNSSEEQPTVKETAEDTSAAASTEAERATETVEATEAERAAGVEMVMLTLLMLLVVMLSVVLCRPRVETAASTPEQAAGETATSQHTRAGSRGDNTNQHSRAGSKGDSSQQRAGSSRWTGEGSSR